MLVPSSVPQDAPDQRPELLLHGRSVPSRRRGRCARPQGRRRPITTARLDKVGPKEVAEERRRVELSGPRDGRRAPRDGGRVRLPKAPSV